MSDTDSLERTLVEDLGRLGDRLGDERLVHDLYRALAGTALSRSGETGHVSLSWSRAAELLNAARAGQALGAIDGLPQSGGEGEVGKRAQEALGELGWTVRPESHDRSDRAHSGAPASPPPAGGEEPAWKREGDEAAERERLRRT
jgi:hypothetical protein